MPESELDKPTPRQSEDAPRIPAIVSQNGGYRSDWAQMAELIAACFESGALTNNGTHVRQFETELANYLRVSENRMVVVDHGQSALVLALKQLPIPLGSYVVVPDLTFTGTVSAVLAAGHVPVLGPVDSDSLMLTCETLDVARRQYDVKAAIAVEYVGLPCDRYALSDYCRLHDIQLIYDSAAAFGAELNRDGVESGTAGFVAPDCHFYCYSFHATKPLTAVEGGAVFCPSDDAAVALREMRNFGISLENRLVTNRPGFNAKMSELHAITGRFNLRSYGEAVTRRRAVVDGFARQLSQAVPRLVPELLRPVVAPKGAKPVWWFVPYLFSKEAVKSRADLPARFRDALNQAGIGVSNNYYPIQHLAPAFRSYPSFDDWEHDLVERLVLFPCRPDLTEREVGYIVETVGKVTHSLLGI